MLKIRRVREPHIAFAHFPSLQVGCVSRISASCSKGRKIISKPTGLMRGVGAESREETWLLSMTIMRTVSYACGNQAVRETVLYTSSLSFTDFVSSYLRDLMLPTWIGLSDLLAENQYAWSDGVSPVLYTNWNDKEPNNAGGTVSMLKLCSE